MAAAETRKTLHFEDNSEIPDINLDQPRDSVDADFDDTDETIRPGYHALRTRLLTEHTTPGVTHQAPSWSTFVPGERTLYTSGASLQTTPLLSGRRRWSSHSAPFAYGTMAVPCTQQTALQHTRSVSDRDAQLDPEAGERTGPKKHFIRTWLTRLNVPTHIRLRQRLTTHEEVHARLDSDESSTQSLKESMTKTLRRLESRSAQLGTKMWRSPYARAIFALSFMLLLSATVFGIGYRVHKLATMDRRDR